MGIPYLSERDPVEPLYFRDRYYSSCDSCGHKKANYLQRIYFDKKMENLENCACMCLDQRYKFKKGRDFVVMELPSFIPYVNQNLRVSSFVIAYLKIPKKLSLTAEIFLIVTFHLKYSLYFLSCHHLILLSSIFWIK